MAAKDYSICTGLADAYIAKVGKDGKISGKDKRLIPDNVIMSLIVWWLKKRLEGTENNVTEISQDGKPVVEVRLLKD